MDGFVGRNAELQKLEEIYAQRSGSCAVSGRRHMGKTTMLARFCEGKKHLYISGMKGIPHDNYLAVKGELSRFAGRSVEIPDMIELFPTIASLCGKEKVVVVIDRYSELVDNFSVIESGLREFMSRTLSNTRIMLVVCDEDSSIFDRFFTNIEVKKMNYLECARLHPEYSPRQNLLVYSMVGGVPAYHGQFSGDPMDIMRMRMFDHMSFFCLEAECFFMDDTRSNQHFRVMSALGSGAYNARMVSDKTGIPLTACNKILEEMHNRDLVVRESSGGRMRSYNYFIGSYLLKFYFEVVNKYSYLAEYYGPDKAYAEANGSILKYLEDTFKEVCMEYVDVNYEVDNIQHVKGRDVTDGNSVDFTAVVFDKQVRRNLYAICRLDGEMLGTDDLESMKNYGRIKGGSNRFYFLFSDCGFTDELKAEVKGNMNIKLITLEDMYRY